MQASLSRGWFDKQWGLPGTAPWDGRCHTPRTHRQATATLAGERRKGATGRRGPSSHERGIKPEAPLLRSGNHAARCLAGTKRPDAGGAPRGASLGGLLQSRVLGLGRAGGIDELGEARFGRVLEDEGFHQLVPVAAVDEAVEHGVDAAVHQGQALRDVQRREQEVLQLAAEGQVVQDGEDVQQHHDVVGQPAHEEDHHVGEDDLAAAVLLRVAGGGDGPRQQAVEDGDDREGDGEAQDHGDQLHADEPLLDAVLGVEGPAVGLVVGGGRDGLQIVGVRQGHAEGQQPHQDADGAPHRLLLAAGRVGEVGHGQVAVHAHAREEEDAAEEVDGEDEVGDLAGELAHGPLVMLHEADHPDRDGDHHPQVGDGQVQDVAVRVVARGLGLDVHPDHHGVGDHADDEDEDVNEGQRVQQDALVGQPGALQRVHHDAVAAVAWPADVGEVPRLRVVEDVQVHGSGRGQRSRASRLGSA